MSLAPHALPDSPLSSVPPQAGETVSDAELTRLVELDKAATQGPWFAGWGGDPEIEGKDEAGPINIVSPYRGGVASCEPIPSGDASTWDKVEANANFIAALRNAAPSLLSELVSLRKELADLKEDVQDKNRDARFERDTRD